MQLICWFALHKIGANSSDGSKKKVRLKKLSYGFHLTLRRMHEMIVSVSHSLFTNVSQEPLEEIVFDPLASALVLSRTVFLLGLSCWKGMGFHPDF